MTHLLRLVHDAPTTADVPTMRRAVRSAIQASAYATDIDDVELVAGEILANAVVHGHGPVTVTLEVTTGERLRLTVTDAAADTPPPAPADAALAESGRGLMVVAAVASDWGWTLNNDGTKTVWAVFAPIP